MDLPPELLLVIFEQVKLPLTLRAVCGTWRDIVDASPPLWQHVELDTRAAPIHALHRRAKLFLERSQQVPIEVSIWADHVDYVLPILSPMLSSIPRWRTFATEGFRTEHLDMTQVPEVTSALVIHIHDYDSEDLEDGEPGEDSPFAVLHPTFDMAGGMELWLTALPPSNQLVAMHFTRLTITESISNAAQTSISAITGVLYACPALRHFRFEGWIPDEGHSTFTYVPPSTVVELTYLQSLCIKTTTMTRGILSSIIAPRLDHLILTYLNIARPVDVEPRLEEPGESDDEASDFSESPWTDRATGMGMRTFISHSLSPIRKLDMDYSDFRTKDFIWAFDRLEYLEEFRIVGSDMSDKVIGLFGPALGSRMKLRLPKLSYLGLFACQRLTGDAVVAALVQRAVMTDSNSEYSKLRLVRISGCGGVTAEHNNLLSAALGSRFVP